VAVRAKRGWKPKNAKPEPKFTTARDIMQSEHPVNKHFVSWCKDKEPTRRQARKFLQAFPQYVVTKEI